MLKSVQQVWSLEKDESIKHLLILLFSHFGEGELVASGDEILLFSHFGEGELVASGDELCHDRAISLMHKHDHTVRVYVYTYGHDSGRYGVHVEYPVESLSSPLDYPASYENVSFDQIADIIELNLNICRSVSSAGNCGLACD